MYYTDGEHLMLTHYCSMNNQPRMRANAHEPGGKALVFVFLDATNLKSPSDAHMHQITFDFKNRDHFNQVWVLSKAGKELPKTVTFERIKYGKNRQGNDALPYRGIGNLRNAVAASRSMPELPDLTVYREALERLMVEQRLVKVRLVSPFLLRTAEQALSEVEGGSLLRVSRIGKRLILAMTSDLFLVVESDDRRPSALEEHRQQDSGQDRVSYVRFYPWHAALDRSRQEETCVVACHQGERALSRFAMGGIEPLEADLESFRAVLTRENHILDAR